MTARPDRTYRPDEDRRAAVRSAPWFPKELRRFWALARSAGMDIDAVHAAITAHYPTKMRLHDLTRVEFLRLLNDLSLKTTAGSGLAKQLRGQALYFDENPSKSKPDPCRLSKSLSPQGGRPDPMTLDGYFAGQAMERSWRRIRWLQRQLGWSDARLVNYVLWHGSQSGSKIDHIRWLTVGKARGIITGMEKIRQAGREKGGKQ